MFNTITMLEVLHIAGYAYAKQYEEYRNIGLTLLESGKFLTELSRVWVWSNYHLDYLQVFLAYFVLGQYWEGLSVLLLQLKTNTCITYVIGLLSINNASFFSFFITRIVGGLNV